MNFGKSVKKLTNGFNVLFSIYKSAGLSKTNSPSKALEELKWNELFRLPISVPLHNIKLANLCKPHEEKFIAIIKNDVPLQKKIQEPGKITNIKIKLPVGNLKDELHLPCSIEKEIEEPKRHIIRKRAYSYKKDQAIKGMHIVNIRRRKMRIHKRKKYMRKHKVELMKKKADRTLKKEYDFQMQLKDIIKTCESFSPEAYLNNTLKTSHWERPVTKVRGILAPQWVIKEHLNKKKEEKILQQRLEVCINFKK